MSHVGHFFVFWLAGLLTGALLGWTLARTPANEARATRGKQAPARAGARGADRARAA